MIDIVRVVFATLAFAASAPTAEAGELSIFRDWVRARCIAVAAGDTPFGRDAAASAGAFVEKGTLPAEAYQAGEVLIAAALARELKGSVDVRFDTLKCLDLAAGRAVAAVVAPRHRGR